MSHQRRRTGYLRQSLLLGAIPLVLMSTGYALFSQTLNVGTTVSKPLYSSSQYIYASYTKTETPSGNVTNYSLNPVTISNKGVTATTAWQLKYDLPTDAMSSLVCSSAVTCTKSGTTVTVVNGAGNGALAAGGTTTFTMSFTSSTAKYVLQNIYVSGTFSAAYQTIAGLTVSTQKGTSSKKGSIHTYPYTFTISNSTTQPLSAWQAVCTWPSNPTTTTVDTTVNYVSSASNITLTSKTALAANSNIVVNASFVINRSTWAVGTCTVQGKA